MVVKLILVNYQEKVMVGVNILVKFTTDVRSKTYTMKNIIGRIKCLFGKHDFVFKNSRLEYDYNKHGYYHRIIKECRYCERQRHEFMTSIVRD